MDIIDHVSAATGFQAYSSRGARPPKSFLAAVLGPESVLT